MSYLKRHGHPARAAAHADPGFGPGAQLRERIRLGGR